MKFLNLVGYATDFKWQVTKIIDLSRHFNNELYISIVDLPQLQLSNNQIIVDFQKLKNEPNRSLQRNLGGDIKFYKLINSMEEAKGWDGWENVRLEHQCFMA